MNLIYMRCEGRHKCSPARSGTSAGVVGELQEGAEVRGGREYLSIGVGLGGALFPKYVDIASTAIRKFDHNDFRGPWDGLPKVLDNTFDATCLLLRKVTQPLSKAIRGIHGGDE